MESRSSRFSKVQIGQRFSRSFKQGIVCLESRISSDDRDKSTLYVEKYKDTYVRLSRFVKGVKASYTVLQLRYSSGFFFYRFGTKDLLCCYFYSYRVIAIAAVHFSKTALRNPGMKNNTTKVTFFLSVTRLHFL